MFSQISALNPEEPQGNIDVIAEWCNDHKFDHYKLLYSAAALSLEGLIHEVDKQKMLVLGRSLLFLPTDKHRFVAVNLILKSLLSAYRPQIMWISEYNFKNTAVPSGRIKSLAVTCRSKGLSLSGLLDVALCRAAAEELIEKRGKEDNVLNCDLLIEAAEGGKMVGRQLWDLSLEDRVASLLRVTRAMCANILGGCGKSEENNE
ncbi:MAG: hypothetical protein ACOY46_16260 [Bacillota bacterium]